MSGFWSAALPPQIDYERLRAAVLADGRLPDGVAAARFTRRGLAGLIVWPDREPVFSPRLIGAARPAWTPHADPRLAALSACYRLLLAAGPAGRDPTPIPAARHAAGREQGECDASGDLRPGFQRRPADAGHDRLAAGGLTGPGRGRKR